MAPVTWPKSHRPGVGGVAEAGHVAEAMVAEPITVSPR
jgi:hypothetical protein